MEEHPIPQDVTGFQFKLIGAMTVKQFAYVAFGVIVAFIIYYMPINILLKVFFIPLFGGSGFLIAFLPIEGRPVDVMTGNFLKALFSPNQYIYQKLGRSFDFASMPTPHAVAAGTPIVHRVKPQSKGQQLQVLLHNTQTSTQNKLDEKETAFLKSLSIMPLPTPVAINPTPKPLPSQAPAAPAPEPKNVLNQQEDSLLKQLEQAKKEESVQQASPNAAAVHQKVALLEKQIQTLHAQRQELDQQLQKLQTQLTAKQTSSPAPTTATKPAAVVTTPPPPPPPTQQAASSLSGPSGYVHNIPLDMAKKAGLPHISDTPNVVVGIVKDSRGNVLSNMLVEIKDKEGNPVRAFKTNTLGQFASATPLAPGVYTIELEDTKKQHNFDVIQITSNNQIMLPIEIISHDERDELRKQLFN